MKRYRATIDLYVNLDGETDEETAKSYCNHLIDHINMTARQTDFPVEASEIYKDEIYDTEEQR